MVGARALLGDESLGAGLELPVLDDGEADAADFQVGIVDRDAALDRGRVVGVGQVAGLRALDLVDVFHRHEEAAVGAGAGRGLLAAGSPDVGLPDIVVVGNGDGRDGADDLTEVAAELEPGGVVTPMVVDLVT